MKKNDTSPIYEKKIRDLQESPMKKMTLVLRKNQRLAREP